MPILGYFLMALYQNLTGLITYRMVRIKSSIRPGIGTCVAPFGKILALALLG